MPPKTSTIKTLLATCRDNLGIEDKFDQGIEYIAEEHADSDMVWVTDKFGVRQECFKSRFSFRVEEEVDVMDVVVDADKKRELEVLMGMADVIMGKSTNGINSIQRGWLEKAWLKNVRCEVCGEEENDKMDWCDNCEKEAETCK